MKYRALISYALLLTGIGVLGWCFTGLLVVEKMEDEGYSSFFLKKKPSWRLVFHNPYASDPTGDDFRTRTRLDSFGNWRRGTAEFTEFLNYCKARYGLEDIENPALAETCNALHKNDSIYARHFIPLH